MDRTELSQLLSQILDRITRAKTIENEVYAMLVTMFPTVIAPALEILDNGRITKIVCQKSKRHFHKVKEVSSSSSTQKKSSTSSTATDDDCSYDVMGDHCFCYFYARECLAPAENGSAALCKHVLAVRLAEALELVVLKEIEDRDFGPMLLQSRAYLTRYDDASNVKSLKT